MTPGVAEDTRAADRVLAAVATVTGVPAYVLRGRRRTRRVARARAVLCFVAYMDESCTLCEIAAALGGRDHTTIMAARDAAAGDRTLDGEVRAVRAILAAPVRGAEA